MGKRKVIGIVSMVLGGLSLIDGIVNNNFEGIPPGILFLLIGLFLIIKKPKTQAQKEERAKAIERQKALVYGKHQAGLPLSEGLGCELEGNLSEDNLTITGGGNTFKLAFSKITDMVIKTDTEIQKSYVSSVGGAIGGAVLFGPLGAMIGGRAKEKKSTTTIHYLIITYLKDGEVSYIGFDVSLNVSRAQNLVKTISSKFRPIGQTINL
ncbi:hypothetical protein [Desulfosporosinus youngiae]|uniref:Uncharacterized protein n=1 Tax=Desulfosporosinus youngiae DSM 17734 TaxID=768710 RepID=H5Y2M9_9FIRM|nr:hypothetical protein [Desulfosporosinus youngiae]EHQ88292.1 hypothetical protein DesyoDRAFT_1122 [Desulfosporosinus youngiae DSM 17734]